MTVVEMLYEAAAHAGLLHECLWRPTDGSSSRAALVGLRTTDDLVLDQLTVSTETVMTYPASTFLGLDAGERVEIGDAAFQVRTVRLVGDGSEVYAQLTRLP